MAQQGFLYEENAAKFLKPYGLVPKSFIPAGAGHGKPDLLLSYNKKQSGCELKIKAASAGSLVIKYDSSKKKPWGFNDIDPDDEEKVFICDLANSVKLFDLIDQKWKKVPYKRVKDSTWDATAGKLTPQARYERDLKTFPDIKGEIPASKIENYYNKKDCWYVNVGTHGFYLLGSKNPLGLKNIPSFGTSANAKYRARIQYKGNYNYQIMFEMAFSMKTKSPYNIAPVDGKTVTIVKRSANLSCFPNL